MPEYSYFKQEEIFHQADQDIKDGFYEDAVRRLEDLITDDPGFGRAYNHLGWLYENKFRNSAKAEEFYRKAFEKSPEYPPIYTNYAILLSALGKYELLEFILTQGLQTPGVDKSTMYNEFGIMYEQRGLYDKAIDYYKECGKATLVKEALDRAIASIERCKTKKQFL